MLQKRRLELTWLWNDLVLTARRTRQEFVDDRCTQIAASISYYVFFSIFPLTIFLVTVFGQLLRDDNVKEQVLETLLDIVPLAQDGGREQLESTLNGVSTDLSLLGLLSIVGLVWSASAMMSAIRVALNTAWDAPLRRPPLRGKLIDFFMLALFAVLIAVSIIATGLRDRAQDLVTDLSTHIGALDSVLQTLLWLATFLTPILISFVVFAALYRWVPAVRTSFDEIWPGALTAALAFELAKIGFTIYIRNFATYNAVYGSLGAVIVFMFFIFIAANVLLVGAEVASEWPRVRAGHYDHGMPERFQSSPRAATLRGQLVEILRQSMFVPEHPPEHIDNREIEMRLRLRAEAEARRNARLREAETVSDERTL
jgi:membrane protein